MPSLSNENLFSINYKIEEGNTMLDFFTDPYPDEVMYSVFARYQNYCGKELIYSFKELLGVKHSQAYARKNFPRKLDYFCQQFNQDSNYIPLYFIENHTIVPYYKPFLLETYIKRMIEGIKYEGQLSEINWLTKSVDLEHKEYKFKTCNKCIEEDQEAYGEAYLHRIHQVPYNFFCNKHNMKLNFYILPHDKQRLQYYSLEKALKNIERSEYVINFEEQFLILSKEIELLFNDKDLMMYYGEMTQKKYKDMLNEKGLFIGIELINQKELYNEFLQYYKSEFLKEIEAYVEEEYIGNMKNWIKRITTNAPTTIAPIKHLLFIKFLFGGLNNFKDYHKKY